MEGDEEVIFCETPDWKPLFLLKIKIKQNPSCPNKEYNGIFKHIYQNTMAYPRSKKNLHWAIIGKILLCIGKNLRKSRLGKPARFVPNVVAAQQKEDFATFTLI